MSYVHRLRVRYSECDAQHHVFNANYLTYFDVTITELWRDRLGGYEEMLEGGVDMVVAEASVRYLAPARFDDELEIGVALDAPTNSSLVSRFGARRGNDLLTEGTLRHVCVDAKTFAKTPWPDDLRAALDPYVG